MPELTAAQRGQGPWRDPGRWTCLDPECMPPWWRDGGSAAWRYHAARYHHPGRRRPCLRPTVVALIEDGRQDDTVRATTDHYLEQLVAHLEGAR